MPFSATHQIEKSILESKDRQEEEKENDKGQEKEYQTGLIVLYQHHIIPVH